MRYNDLRSETSRSHEECRVVEYRYCLAPSSCFSQTCRRASRNVENILIFFRTEENNRSRHFNNPRDLAMGWNNKRSVGNWKWNIGKCVDDENNSAHSLFGRHQTRLDLFRGIKTGWKSILVFRSLKLIISPILRSAWNTLNMQYFITIITEVKYTYQIIIKNIYV